MRKAHVALLSMLFAISCIGNSAAVSAQTRDKFVISARAGGVNSVSGGASVRAHGNSEWQQLTIKEDLETGDVVKTGADGRVEMLLNPGSYLRIGENSEFELSDSSLENLELRLIRGTAIVEATGADDTELLINITTPHTRLAIVRRGLYRLNVVPGDNTELIVRKGRVMLDRSHTKIQGGNKVVFNSENFFIARLEKAEKKKVDNIDLWSKERAETVAQANRKMRSSEIRTLMSSIDDNWTRVYSNRFTGFWFYNPRFGCYTFMPFLIGWGSPYGGSYNGMFANYYYNGFYGQFNNGYPAPTASNPSGGGSAGNPSSPSPRPMPSTPMPSEPRPMSPAMENRINRHADRAPNP